MEYRRDYSFEAVSIYVAIFVAILIYVELFTVGGFTYGEAGTVLFIISTPVTSIFFSALTGENDFLTALFALITNSAIIYFIFGFVESRKSFVISLVVTAAVIIGITYLFEYMIMRSFGAG